MAALDVQLTKSLDPIRALRDSLTDPKLRLIYSLQIAIAETVDAEMPLLMEHGTSNEDFTKNFCAGIAIAISDTAAYLSQSTGLDEPTIQRILQLHIAYSLKKINESVAEAVSPNDLTH